MLQLLWKYGFDSYTFDLKRAAWLNLTNFAQCRPIFKCIKRWC